MKLNSIVGFGTQGVSFRTHARAAPCFQGLEWVKCRDHNSPMKYGYARVSTDDREHIGI